MFGEGPDSLWSPSSHAFSTSAPAPTHTPQPVLNTVDISFPHASFPRAPFLVAKLGSVLVPLDNTGTEYVWST